MKPITVVISCLISLNVSATAWAGVVRDTYEVNQQDALSSNIELEVTPQGIVIDLGSPILTIFITHKSNVTVTGFNGILCITKANCGDKNPPTMLFARKIPKIDFKDEEAMSDGTSMLFIYTTSGTYRFRLVPKSKKPQYTKVEIQQEQLYPLVSEQKN